MHFLSRRNFIYADVAYLETIADVIAISSLISITSYKEKRLMGVDLLVNCFVLMIRMGDLDSPPRPL